MTSSPRSVLSEELLRSFHERAAGYDHSNTFFHEDFRDLQDAGYLTALVPEELGGLGFDVHEFNLEQRRLAYWAPATALGINMHLYWTGPAADAFRRGDSSTEWILRETVAGKVFAAGHGEPGNDAGVADSTTVATPVEGGYLFRGRKVFTSLSPVWDWLGIHGRDDSDPDHPKIVHAFVHRSTPGIRTVETWDTLGVRATSSHDTVLEDVLATSDHVIDIHPVGQEPGPFISAIFPWAVPTLGNIYVAIARRALDVAIEHSKTHFSRTLGGAPISDKPHVRSLIADGEIALDAAGAQLSSLTTDLAAGVDHGNRAIVKLLAAKENGVATALRVVDTALDIVGAASLHRRNELERLYRDVRAGSFHPPSAQASRELIAAAVLAESTDTPDDTAGASETTEDALAH